MRKAIQLKVTLWIQGEDEPPNDFAKATMQHVRDIIATGKGARADLKITIKEIIEDRSLGDA